METTHEPLHLHKLSFAQCMILDTQHLKHFFFEEVLKYGECAILWGYVRTCAETICEKFCNFVQSHCQLFNLLLNMI
jgi:hypothetical protein